MASSGTPTELDILYYVECYKYDTWSDHALILFIYMYT